MSTETSTTVRSTAGTAPITGTTVREWAHAVTKRLAEVVSAAIKTAGLSQREVASRTGIPMSTLSRRLTGRGRPFFVGELFDIGDVIGVSASEPLAAAEDQIESAR